MFAVDVGKSWGLSKRFRKDAVHLWVAKSAAARGQGAGGLSTTPKRGGFFSDVLKLEETASENEALGE